MGIDNQVMMAALPHPKTIRNLTPSVQDRTKEFLTLFSKIRNIESKELEERNFSIEERIHRLLVFYEHHKHNIDRKFINKIMFSELPNLCFEEHVEDSTLLVDVLRTIHALPPIVMPHLVLFLTLLGLTHRTLPHSNIRRRNELRKGSFSAITYFLHHAYKKRLTFQNQRLTDMIVCTDPLLFSKFLFFAETRCTRTLLQFGLRFELPDKTATQIHPIFICAAELLSWFIKKSRWSNDNLERPANQQHYIEKMFAFSQNFKLLLVSTANPYEITSQIIYILPRCSGLDDYDKLKSYLKHFFPYADGETYQPPSLKYMCRYTIRSRLDENWCLPNGVWKLSLPRRLLCYLNFSKCSQK